MADRGLRGPRGAGGPHRTLRGRRPKWGRGEGGRRGGPGRRPRAGGAGAEPGAGAGPRGRAAGAGAAGGGRREEGRGCHGGAQGPGRAPLPPRDRGGQRKGGRAPREEGEGGGNRPPNSFPLGVGASPPPARPPGPTCLLPGRHGARPWLRPGAEGGGGRESCAPGGGGGSGDSARGCAACVRSPFLETRGLSVPSAQAGHVYSEARSTACFVLCFFFRGVPQPVQSQVLDTKQRGTT